MLDAYKRLVTNQFEAALCGLNACIEQCPAAGWDAPVVNLKFCQAVFHTLFYTDFYLESSEATFKQQPFHNEHADYFRDYEEFEDRKQQLLYDRPTTRLYLNHCRAKAIQVVGGEDADTLIAPCKFPRREFSRAELHVYNIRHIEHHVAQLSLRLRIDTGEGVAWMGSGWRDG